MSDLLKVGIRSNCPVGSQAAAASPEGYKHMMPFHFTPNFVPISVACLTCDHAVLSTSELTANILHANVHTRSKLRDDFVYKLVCDPPPLLLQQCLSLLYPYVIRQILSTDVPILPHSK
jgi:hypothetical protein